MLRAGLAPDAVHGARRSALGARRSALGARRSALGARRSALGARRSALIIPPGNPGKVNRIVVSPLRTTAMSFLPTDDSAGHASIVWPDPRHYAVFLPGCVCDDRVEFTFVDVNTIKMKNILPTAQPLRGPPLTFACRASGRCEEGAYERDASSWSPGRDCGTAMASGRPRGLRSGCGRGGRYPAIVPGWRRAEAGKRNAHGAVCTDDRACPCVTDERNAHASPPPPLLSCRGSPAPSSANPRPNAPGLMPQGGSVPQRPCRFGPTPCNFRLHPSESD